MIAIVDYGAGNLTSVRKAFSAIGAEIFTPARSADLTRAKGIVVPGVGHFDATSRLDAPWREAIGERLEAGTPLLGICVGLQWLFEGSTEAPGVRGLGLFTGECAHLSENGVGADFREPENTGRKSAPTPFSGRLKVPHVGWNSLALPRPSALMAGIPEGSQVYFTHSYAAPVIPDTVAICEYGMPFSAAVERGNVAAVQFHPEKSGPVGLQVLRNWVNAL